jgi:hypothetical protein
MPDGELIKIQVAPESVQSSATATATDLILPPVRMADRLRHFSENVYDVSPESHLAKFMKVLLGDAGAGRLKKRLTVQRMRSTLQGTHFYDLDRFYGPLFGIRRDLSEVLPFNPFRTTVTREQWDDAYARDASFRSRIEQLARAVSYGPTPVGMELIAEAILAVDCEIYEGWIKADGSFQTYQELEDLPSQTNLLTDENASIEVGTGDWVAGPDTSMTQENSGAFQGFPDGFTTGGGQWALRLRSTAAGDPSASLPDQPVTAGDEYTFAAVVFAEDSERDIHVEIEWYDSGPALISTIVGGAVTVPVQGIAQVYAIGEAPVGAETATLVMKAVGATVSFEDFFFDRMEFSTSQSIPFISRADLMTLLGPLAWWRFDEAGGTTTADSSGNGHGLTWSGGTSLVDSGGPILNIDGLASLDGDDFATVTSEDALELRQDMSIEMWVRPSDATGANQAVITCRGTGADAPLYEVYYNPDLDTFFFYPRNTAGAASQIGSFLVHDEWHHIAITIEWVGGTRTLRRYVNGERFSVIETGLYQPGVLTRSVNVGRRAVDADLYFNGDISEISVFDYALTASQVRNLYKATYQDE